MNFCSECGFKIHGDYKFCPNCGSKINLSVSAEKSLVIDKNQFIICKNCGEENSVESSICFSCGVQLSGTKNKKPENSELSKKTVSDSVRKKVIHENQNSNSTVKTLSNKTILVMASSVVAVFILALILSGSFDTDIPNNINSVSEQSSDSGINLNNLNEINALEKKILENPEDMESTLHLAHLSQDSGLYEKAIENYKKYLLKNPGNADARVDMGICYYNLGDNTMAITEMESALKYQPKHQVAHLNLGIVNLTSQNIEISKQWFRKAVELDPNSEAGKRAQELLNSH